MQITAGWYRISYSTPINYRPFMLLIIGICALLLSACSKPDLYTKLTEEHANEMVAVLSEAGISANKKSAAENEWAVSVAQSDFAKAVDTLRARGLPREKYESVGTIFKAGGLTETPLAQQARLTFGKQEELRETISKFDGVVEARVQLALPEPNSLTDEIKPATASVLVKHRTGFDLRSKKAEIQTLVANGVDGLSFERVSVVIIPAQSLPIVKTPDSSLSFDTIGRLLIGLLAIGMLAFAVRTILRQRRVSTRGRLTTVEDDGSKT